MITVAEKDEAVIITIEKPSSTEQELINKAKNMQMVSAWERTANTAKKRWGTPVEKQDNISQWKQISERGEAKKNEELIQEMKNQSSPVIHFGLVIKDSQGIIIRNLNESDFENGIMEAIEIANWYEDESRNNQSDFYRCSVERTGYLKKIDDSLNFIQDFEPLF